MYLPVLGERFFSTELLIKKLKKKRTFFLHSEVFNFKTVNLFQCRLIYHLSFIVFSFFVCDRVRLFDVHWSTEFFMQGVFRSFPSIKCPNKKNPNGHSFFFLTWFPHFSKSRGVVPHGLPGNENMASRGNF